MLHVSICIVAYNEEKSINALFNDIIAQTYPHNLIEIVLIDSMSEDKTKTIMRQFSEMNISDFYDIQVLDNPRKIQASGWNVAIDNYKGDILTRIDAHSRITPNFVEKVVQDIEQGEKIVGGKRPCLIEKETKWADILLRVENSLFGSSINPSKRDSQKQYVKTMFHASYTREVIDSVGHFNETLLRTEDNEMHYRMRKVGYKFFFDPEIVSYQLARNNLKKMIKQKYGNGYWIGMTLKKCPGCISFYHLVPGMFFLSCFFTTILALFGIWQFAALMWGLYILFCILSMVLSSIGEPYNAFIYIMPFLFLVLHLSYGIGTIIGITRETK